MENTHVRSYLPDSNCEITLSHTHIQMHIRIRKQPWNVGKKRCVCDVLSNNSNNNGTENKLLL